MKMKQLNKVYNKLDNDTYVDKYSDNIFTDAEIHMFADPSGSSIMGNSIRGKFTVESRIFASNNILKFPTSTMIGIPKIKDVKVYNLIPMTLVHRYNHKEDELKIHHKSPVFYDTTANKFVLMLDHRFIRDISITELNIEDKSIYKIYKDKKNKDNNYIGILFKSIEELEESYNKDNKSNPFTVFLDAYKLYKMTIQGGEKVIVLKVASLENKNVGLFNHNLKKHIGNSMTTRQFQFEYAVFVRFDKRYYLCDNNGNIIQSSSIIIDKEKDQLNTENNMLSKLTEISLFGTGEDSHTFIVPYSIEQLDIIESISKRIHAIHNELRDLFINATCPESNFDNPVLSIPKESKKLNLLV